MIAKSKPLPGLEFCLFETGPYYSAPTGLDGTCRPGWPQTQKLSFLCLLLSAGVKGVCQQAPQNLEFYFDDIDFEDLHGLTDTAGKIEIWMLLKPIGRSGLRADGFSILVLLVFLRDKILLCYPTDPFLL